MSQNSGTDLAALGELMRRAGVSPDRVESMISEIIAGDVESRSIARIERELRALREMTGDVFDKLHIDQESSSIIIQSAIFAFENRLIQINNSIVKAIRLRILFMIALIFLQYIISGIILYVITDRVGGSHIENDEYPGENHDSMMFLFGQDLRSDALIRA